MGFPGGSAAKNLPAMQETQENADSIPGSGRSPEGRNGNPLAWRIQGHRSLMDYSPQSRKESDATEQLSMYTRIERQIWHHSTFINSLK